MIGLKRIKREKASDTLPPNSLDLTIGERQTRIKNTLSPDKDWGGGAQILCFKTQSSHYEIVHNVIGYILCININNTSIEVQEKCNFFNV